MYFYRVSRLYIYYAWFQIPNNIRRPYFDSNSCVLQFTWSNWFISWLRNTSLIKLHFSASNKNTEILSFSFQFSNYYTIWDIHQKTNALHIAYNVWRHVTLTQFPVVFKVNVVIKPLKMNNNKTKNANKQCQWIYKQNRNECTLTCLFYVRIFRCSIEHFLHKCCQRVSLPNGMDNRNKRNRWNEYKIHSREGDDIEKERHRKKKCNKNNELVTDTKRKFHNSLFLYNLLFTHMQNFSRISRLTGIHTTAHAHTQEKKEITFDTGRKSYII